MPSLLQVAEKTINLADALPNPRVFQVSSVALEIRSLVQSSRLPSSLALTGTDLDEVMQPSSPDNPRLLAWLRRWQMRVHRPPYVGGPSWHSERELGVCMFNGSLHAMAAAFDVLVGPGDAVLLERPTFPSAISMLRVLGADLRPVATDANGLIPADLERALAEAPHARVLYLIPTGQNPSGASLPVERKREIYRIACAHDLLVLEDDPYWNLQMETAFAQQNRSLMSMDVEGRVLRFDSFSKVLSAGLRLGVASGAPALVEKLQAHQQASAQHPSLLSQMLLLRILEHLREEGFEEHLAALQDFYRAQRDCFLRAVDTHLSSMVRYQSPAAGMFLWMEALHHTNTDELVRMGGPKHKVLAVSGQCFQPDDQPSNFFRTSFSTATPFEMDQACQQLASLLSTF